jgi:hypothetical protein
VPAVLPITIVPVPATRTPSQTEVPVPHVLATHRRWN